ncbi:EpsI family protein [Akkermansiaceae bacterium]|nr:EpsI family protein [Akkermansiaceae bacterium]MDA7935850.1 EpsI family protein [bacterium]MDB4498852.1 EpsI family protein [Akkermansiaceae bacterium]MDC1206704.1 EpsI family protein [Akkermansiaceae bacterium]
MTKRTTILLCFSVGLLLLLFLLPNAPQMKPSRLSKELPEQLGDWRGIPREPGALEKKVLAQDTEFRRMEYRDVIGRFPAIETSIVFSGKNLSQSIHRPEVCLRAQGWTFVHENYLSLEGLLPSGAELPVKEMICKRVAMKNPEKKGDKPTPFLNDKGEEVILWRVFYYTFFGHEKIVAGHYQRTLVDMKDRLLEGYDQRWAYATFSAFITSKHAEQGIMPAGSPSFNEEETTGLMKEFLKELLPIMVSDPGEGYDPTLAKGQNIGL